MTVQMTIKTQDTTFYGCENKDNSSKVVYSSSSEEFTCCAVDEMMIWAA